MLTQRSRQRLIQKVNRLFPVYRDYAFHRICELETEILETDTFHTSPPEGSYRPIRKGDAWGAPFGTAWFRTELPAEYADRRVFLETATNATEHLVFLNGEPVGATDVLENGEGPGFRLHRYVEIRAKAGAKIAMEGYASHIIAGCFPFDKPKSFGLDRVRDRPVYDGVYLAEKDEEIWKTSIYLQFLSAASGDRTLTPETREGLWPLYETLFTRLPAFPEEAGREETVKACRFCNAYLEEHLPKKEKKDEFPLVAVIGHSHMDTAWLWDTEETKRKVARTAVNALNLMDRYPDYRFVMSSTLHYEWLKDLYPSLYERVRKYVKEGRFEPNGGSYIECDANLVGGESFVRQFLYGQSFNEREFGYHADTYWLPDTFGYSAALPQILRGFGMDAFMTTKINGNDTNRFPHDNFYWVGIDGSSVLCSFHILHCYVDPPTVNHRYDYIADKDRFPGTLITYGFGDGGGGPDETMAELEKLTEQSALTPRVAQMSVRDFTRTVMEKGKDLPVYEGELYFEAHRGTLTSLSENKKNNRCLENALSAMEKRLAALPTGFLHKKTLDGVWHTLLLNQFHDMLPGTSINRVNENISVRYADAFARLDALEAELSAGDGLFAYNFTDQDQTADLILPPDLPVPEGYPSERFTDLSGKSAVMVFGVSCPAFSRVDLRAGKASAPRPADPFRVSPDGIETPYYTLTLNENGEITSLTDKKSRRQYVADGGLFNKFLAFEDVPFAWDNWDIDEDLYLKERPAAKRTGTQVVCSGLHLRIRNEYDLCRRSKLVQDVVFRADRPGIEFETRIDWHEKHTVLKTSFDTAIVSDVLTSEIQFGYLNRSTHRDTDLEKARHEVCQHRWSDLSDANAGLGLLNDCKYGVSCVGGRICLTLLKSGTHPDTTGDEGVHTFRYALLPHEGGDRLLEVTRAAQAFNRPLYVSGRDIPFRLPLSNQSPEFILETVKFAEDGKGLVIRGYNPLCRDGEADIRLSGTFTVTPCDLMERPVGPAKRTDRIRRKTHRFEILSFRLEESEKMSALNSLVGIIDHDVDLDQIREERLSRQ